MQSLNSSSRAGEWRPRSVPAPRVFRIHFSDDDHIFRTGFFIEQSKRHRTSGMNTGHFVSQRFQILRIHILATNDDHILLAARDKHFPIRNITIIAGQIPAIENAFCVASGRL